MAPPMTSDGRFEIVDGSDTVVGYGTVTDGWVSLTYGDHMENTHTAPLTEFEATWDALPQSRLMTLRAAEGPPPDPFEA